MPAALSKHWKMIRDKSDVNTFYPWLGARTMVWRTTLSDSVTVCADSVTVCARCTAVAWGSSAAAAANLARLSGPWPQPGYSLWPRCYLFPGLGRAPTTTPPTGWWRSSRPETDPRSTESRSGPAGVEKYFFKTNLFKHLFFSSACIHTMTKQIWSYNNSTARCKFLKTLQPGGIRTRDLMFCRRMRWPLCHAARAIHLFLSS
jgi:hypothetical protein